MAMHPTPITVFNKTHSDADDALVKEELQQLINRVSQRDMDTEETPLPESDKRFYLLYVRPGANLYREDWSDELIRIPFSLEPELLMEQMQLEVENLYIAHGTEASRSVLSSFRITEARYFFEHEDPTRQPRFLPNADQFPTNEAIGEAVRKVYSAAYDTLDVLHKQAKKAVAEIEKNAVLVGKKHLNEVCPQIIKETQRYIKFTVLGDQTPEDFLLRHDQTSHAILSGPDMKNLFLALQEIDRDREALERAAGTLNSTRGSGVSHAGDDFEKAAMVLDRTRSVLADEFPILHRIWDKAYLTPDVYFDENKKHPKYRTKEGADAVWKLRSLIFHTLKDSYRANLSLQKTLDQKSIWDLSPLIDTTLEEMKHSDLTIHYRAAQERLEEQEKMSIAATLALVTSVLEAAGSVLSAEPPILLGLAATSAVLSVIDNVYEFLKLRTSDQAYLASLDPRLSLSTEPSYLGFYVSVAFSMLDIKGVKDAVRKLSLARYGDDFTQLASDLAKAG